MFNQKRSDIGSSMKYVELFLILTVCYGLIVLSFTSNFVMCKLLNETFTNNDHSADIKKFF